MRGKSVREESVREERVYGMSGKDREVVREGKEKSSGRGKERAVGG